MLTTVEAYVPRYPAPARFLRLPEVSRRTGLPRGSIYEQIGLGLFPKPVSLTNRTVGWIESEVDAWIEARIRARSA